MLTLTVDTPALNQCFRGSAAGTPGSPKSKSALLLGSELRAPLQGLVCRAAVGGGSGALVSVHCAPAPEVLIKLRLQEKQKLHSHFGRPQSPQSEQLGEFHITSVPQALGGSDPKEHSPSSLQGPDWPQ